MKRKIIVACGGALLFESFVLSWLKISTVDAVRKQLKLSWNAVAGCRTSITWRGR